MSLEQILALAAGAVLVFWMVGAYNRLMALRNAIASAWAKVDDALRQRAAAAPPLLEALREPLAAETGAPDPLKAALAEVARAAATMGARPLVQAHAAAWATAEAAVTAAGQVFARLEDRAESPLHESVVAPAAAWREAEARLAFARQLFNDAAQTYDEAIALFPTRLLSRVFGFGPAGRL